MNTIREKSSKFKHQKESTESKEKQQENKRDLVSRRLF
jgi:hypothetical protein